MNKNTLDNLIERKAKYSTDYFLVTTDNNDFKNNPGYAILLDENNALDRVMNSIEKMHCYKITPPNSEKGRWQTFIKLENGKRKNIKAPTKKALIKLLYDYYSGRDKASKLTFKVLFDEWADYKKALVNSPNTVLKYKQLFKRFFSESVLQDMPIISIDTMLLEKTCNSIIKDHNLTRKCWNNVKTILNGMFEYACRMQYITHNPVKDLQIMVKFKQAKKKGLSH